MNRVKLSPSMMCCDFFDLSRQLALFENGGIELLHMDIMDGHFVPNFALGADFVRQLRRHTEIPMDIHLMTETPDAYLDLFDIREGDYVSVHYETARHLQRTLARVRDKGAKALLALNPATPVFLAQDVLDDIDGFLIMSVNPGFAGQKLIPHAIDKLRAARSFLDEHGKSEAEIEVDGNVSLKNAIAMREAGADIFVLGTSGLFVGDMEENIRVFRRTIV